ncbi:MAG TPA: YraN family protein [Dehalococcoidia bacterium]|nr:YraN family protein [Dehalococcoidia bacterium]
MPASRKQIGTLGEKLALEHLRKRGYHIVETNFRCREGEIDIIAQDKDYLVFVEVRTRRGSSFGTPEESVTAAKKEKLTSLAFAYLQTHRHSPPLWRFDVVAVELDQEGQTSRIELIQNAIVE